jgi:hypothetical protein
LGRKTLSFVILLFGALGAAFGWRISARRRARSSLSDERPGFAARRWRRLPRLLRRLLVACLYAGVGCLAGLLFILVMER